MEEVKANERIMRTVDRAIDNLLAKQANETDRAGVIYTFVWFTAKRMVQAFGVQQARATYAQVIDAIDDQIANAERNRADAATKQAAKDE